MLAEVSTVDVYTFVYSHNKHLFAQDSEQPADVETETERETETQTDTDAKTEAKGTESLEDIIKKTGLLCVFRVALCTYCMFILFMRAEQILSGERPADSFVAAGSGGAGVSDRDGDKDTDGPAEADAKAGTETKTEADTEAETEEQTEEQHDEEGEGEAEEEPDEQEEETEAEEKHTPSAIERKHKRQSARLADRDAKDRPLCSFTTSSPVGFMRPVLWGKNKNPCVVVGLRDGMAYASFIVCVACVVLC